MFTSLHKKPAAAWRKTAMAYGILAVFCGVFSIVYLQFSHGESSPFLVWLFAPALLLGVVPAFLAGCTSVFKRAGITARRFWHSAVATLSCGMLVRAIINISGRYTEYDVIYWVLSGVLFIAAVYVYIARNAHRHPVIRRNENRIEVI